MCLADEPPADTANPLKLLAAPVWHGMAVAHGLRMDCARKDPLMTTENRPDVLHGYKEIGEHVGMTERQAEHLRTNDPTFPTFKIGRKVCALRSKVDAWLADRAAQALAEGRADA